MSRDFKHYDFRTLVNFIFSLNTIPMMLLCMIYLQANCLLDVQENVLEKFRDGIMVDSKKKAADTEGTGKSLFNKK